MPEIHCLQTGVLHRNPNPHVCSIHAYFPSVGVLPNGEMLCTLVLGEAFEATNLRAHLARSVDSGETWQLEEALPLETPGRITSNSCRLTVLPDGELVVFSVRVDRSDHPDEGLTNHRNLGFAPTELLTLRSRDAGHTWSTPQELTPSLIGPCWELCSPITPLRDGRWILPTSTWRDWSGNEPSGKRMVALVSHDKGESWPEHFDVMVDPEQRIIFWESKILELPDGRLLATAWAYDDVAGKDLPNQYVLSEDGGNTWTLPRSTGLLGQTLTPLLLDDGRILSVYRRLDMPGLWANLSRLDCNEWKNESCLPLWGAQIQGLVTTSDNMSHNFNVLRFGAPCGIRLQDGTLFVAFWCYEECISIIRWFKLQVS